VENTRFADTLKRIEEISKMPIFFVIGAPKSGTTWLQLTLNGHPEIHCAGEGHFTDWLGQPLKELLTDYTQKTKFNNDFVYGNHRFYEGFTHNDFRFMTKMAIYLALAKQHIDPGVAWIGDKTPIHTYNLTFLHELFPSARFIAITRDVRDTTVSIIHQRRRLTEEPEFKAGTPEYTEFVEAHTKKWVTVMQQIRTFAKEHEGLCYQLRYEDLHKEPATLAAVLEFLNVDSSPTAIERCRQAGAFERLSGGRKRGEEDQGAFFRKGIVGDWHEALDKNTIDLVQNIAGEELTTLGYL
jgi:hypothetical protein